MPPQTNAYEILSLARKFLADRHPEAVLTGVFILAADRGKVLHVPILAPGELPEDLPSEQRPLRVRILDVLAQAGKPLKGPTLARRAGTTNDPYFRALVSGLKKRGAVRFVRGEGYSLPVNSPSECTPEQSPPAEEGNA